MELLSASVAMITYNSSKYIHQQLESILSNLRDCDELVICDDCSSDNTVDIIKSYNDFRIKLYVNDVNLGVNGNMNKTLSLCSNDIIYLSNADDVWLAGKINSSISKFTNKKVKCVCHDLSITDLDLNIIEKSFNTLRDSKPGLIHNLLRNGFCGPAMCFRRDMLKYILPFPKKMPFWFDEWIGLVCEKHGKTVFYNDVYVFWRRHDGCVSFSSLIKKDFGSAKNNKKTCFKKMKRVWGVLANRFVKMRFLLFR